MGKITGNILYCSAYYSKKTVDIKNWRLLKNGKYDGKYGVYIILYNCRLFFIPVLTIKDILKINSENMFRQADITYIKNVLTCKICGGTGIVDWIQNVIKNPTKISYFKYKTDTKKSPLYIDKNIVISLPTKKKVYDYCRFCKGSGLKENGISGLSIIHQF
jgi:hypothetical protein